MQDNKQTKIQNIDFSFPVPGECGRLRRSWLPAPGTHLFSCQHISRSEMVKHTCLIIHRWSPTIKHTAWSHNFAFINDSPQKNKSPNNDNRTNLYHVVCERVSSFAIGRKRHVRWMNKSNYLLPSQNCVPTQSNNIVGICCQKDSLAVKHNLRWSSGEIWGLQKWW